MHTLSAGTPAYCRASRHHLSLLRPCQGGRRSYAARGPPFCVPPSPLLQLAAFHTHVLEAQGDGAWQLHTAEAYLSALKE